MGIAVVTAGATMQFQSTNGIGPDFSRQRVLSFGASRYVASTFGELIRKARLERGLKQVDLAEAVGVTEVAVVSWERRASWPRRQ